MTLVSTVGGAAGPLYGTLFLEMGKAAGERTTLTAAEWAGVVSAGVAGVQMRGKAEAGDKTMVDALLPAAEALRAAAGSGASLPAACRAAADAAAEGMRATTPLVARKGRASYLGERSAGHQDPGATSSWLLLETAARTFGRARGAHRPTPARAADGRVVGLVVVSHSARLAEGVVELAAQMAGPEVRIGAAGGLDEPGGALGTDAVRVLARDRGRVVRGRRPGPDGPGQRRPLRRAGPRPAGRGAARRGCCSRPRRWSRARSRRRSPPASATPWKRWPRPPAGPGGKGVAPRRGRRPKAPDGRAPTTAGSRRAADGRSRRAAGRTAGRTLTVTVLNPLGLHARPAALLVRTAAGFDAQVEVDRRDQRPRAGERAQPERGRDARRPAGRRARADRDGSAGGGGAGRRPPPRRGRVRRARRGLGGAAPAAGAAARPQPGRDAPAAPEPAPPRRRGAHRAARGAGGGRGTGAARCAAPRRRCRQARRPTPPPSGRRWSGPWPRPPPTSARRRRRRRPRRRRGRGHLRRPPALPRGRGASRAGARRRLLAPGSRPRAPGRRR